MTVPPHARGTNFRLAAPDNTIQGTVRDNTGTAVVGATVTASGSGGSLATATGTDGNYAFNLIDGSWNISASKVGYISLSSPRSLTVPPDHSNIDFLLVPLAEVRHLYLPVVLRGN